MLTYYVIYLKISETSCSKQRRNHFNCLNERQYYPQSKDIHLIEGTTVLCGDLGLLNTRGQLMNQLISTGNTSDISLYSVCANTCLLYSVNMHKKQQALLLLFWNLVIIPS